MNKTGYIVLLVVVVLGLVYWLYNGNKQEVSTDVEATVLTQSVVNASGPASAVLAGAKTVNWQTNNYPSEVGVNINLLRKVSDSPNQFALVRTIVAETPNDGQETWIPGAGENTSDLYVEVTCSSAHQFKAGCSLTDGAVKVN